MSPAPAATLPAAPSDPTAEAQARIAVLDDPVEFGHGTRWVQGSAGAQGPRIAETSLQLSGMHCAACSGLIEAALFGVDGVLAASVSAASERATVRWDPARTRPSALIQAVRSAGYGAVPDAAAPARALRRQAHRQALWRLFVAAFCAMQVMMLATPSYVAGPGELEPDLRQLLNWGSWLLSLPVLAFSAGPFFRGAWLALRQRRIGMDVPVALGVAIAFVASSGATFSPDGVFGHEVYFDSLTMFVSFLLGARYLELRARHRAAEALESQLACLPETAWRVGPDGSVEAVSLQRLRPGDLLRVPLGQAFPADGVLAQGHTQADEALLTGESAPVPKPEGAPVVAGSTNLGAPVLMRVQRVGGDTRLETIVAMMRSASAQRPAAALLADRWAAPFLWTVLLLAAAGAAAWSVIDPSRAVWVAVSVLIVTCPCALSLAVPATLVAAARGLARHGVLLQRLDALERLARVQQVFFDKTGTLTEEALQLTAITRTAAGRVHWADDAAALATAAALAAWSRHPASQALVAAQAERSTPGHDGLAWQQVAEVAGQGVQAQDAQGRTWRLGQAAWAAGVPLADDAAAASQVALACEGELLALFSLDEALRPGAVAAVQALQSAGVQLTLLTGDAQARAQALAQRLGLQDVRARATPEDKLAAVAQAQQQGRTVAMVGDGVNDAPVLARADVSLAMGQGALVARSQADAVITSNDLGDLVHARQRALHAVRIVRQNMVWAAAYNATSIPLALMGWLPPWAAGLGMALSSLLVIGNALRAAR
ncbi:heavy metal translocating P-type ATPase [Rubrivivax rivuli]|uniref:Cadmium-translocating P-type ATPase n=1 Tax=Rubrivivax rivuli TaxID=1862385 RepID=A0A437RFN8_9BURK|nr:cation-translocating P-type ATPase [Rubrivivax rivuli]RVU45565.1 cadmium-translocating P-type ATPase [Rubrivivax rivuli]